MSPNTSTPITSRTVTDRMRVTYALLFTMLFLLAIWGVYALNEMLELGWRKHGMHPRQWDGLRGIFTYPFLHGDLGHLWNNTMSFFTLNGFLFYFYRSIALRVWVWLFLCSGLLLWGLAVDGNHIGASGLIYGLAAFLFMSGVIRNNRMLLRVSLAVAFLYGGIVWWMLPIDDHAIVRGHAVFDTCTLRGGRLYRLEIHLERLLASSKPARILLLLRPKHGYSAQERLAHAKLLEIAAAVLQTGAHDGDRLAGGQERKRGIKLFPAQLGEPHPIVACRARMRSLAIGEQ